jgi:hypothetical protein
MEAPSNAKGGARPVWRRLAGNFYVQLAAAYLVVAAATYIRAFPFRSKYIGKIWLTPLYSYWDPRVTWWAVPAAAAVALATFLIIRAARGGNRWLLAPAAFVNVVAVTLGPAGGRRFPFNWLERFLSDARVLFQAPNVFADYVEATKGVSCHCRVRPGMLNWLLGAFDRLFAGNVYAIELIFIVLACASVPVLYFGARAVISKDESLSAAALFACAPTLLIFGSGPDGFYCLLGTSVLGLGLRTASAARPWLAAVAAGLVLAVALTSSYALAVLAAFLATFAFAAGLARRAWRRPLAVWLLAILTALAALALFQLATGYEHVTVFKRAYRAAQELDSGGDNVFKFVARTLGYGGVNLPKASERSYRIFVFGNIYALFFIMGIPAAVLYARETFRVVTQKQVRRSFYGAAMISFLVVFLFYNFSGLTLAEVERVWLFLVPMFLIPAGVQLARLCRRTGSAALPAVVFGLTAAQSLVYNLLALTAF